MLSYKIVKATKDRMPEVASVFRSSFDATYPSFPILHSSDDDLDYFTNVIFAKDDVYIVEALDRMVGFIAFNAEFIDHLYLLPEAQRQGRGSALIAIAKADQRPKERQRAGEEREDGGVNLICLYIQKIC